MANRGMPPLAIIKNFNVVEHVGSGFCSCVIVTPMNPLPFQRGEETFGHGIIIAISCPAHAAFDTLVP